MLLHVCSYLRRLVITTILILHIRNILLSFSSHLFAFNHTHYITLRSLMLLLTCILSVTKGNQCLILLLIFCFWVYKYTCFPLPIYELFSFDVSEHIVICIRFLLFSIIPHLSIFSQNLPSCLVFLVSVY